MTPARRPARRACTALAAAQAAALTAAILAGFALAAPGAIQPATAQPARPGHTPGDSVIQLRGAMTQGGLVIGRVPPGAKVTLVIDRQFWWEKARKHVAEDIPVAADGLFVFGLGRQAPRRALIRAVLPDERTVVRHFRIRQRRYRIQRINRIPPRYVTPPKHLSARIKREFLMVVNARKTFTEARHFAARFRWPLKGRISGVYGSQRIYNNGKGRRPHFGLDLAAPRGTRVHAPIAGTVLLTHHLYFAGKTVILDHGRGVFTTYIHLHRILVKPGDPVAQGQVIGLVGNTGRSTGPHLHWGMNWRQIPLDPALMMRQAAGGGLRPPRRGPRGGSLRGASPRAKPARRP